MVVGAFCLGLVGRRSCWWWSPCRPVTGNNFAVFSMVSLPFPFIGVQCWTRIFPHNSLHPSIAISMAGNLEEAWSRLSLTEEEATVVEFDEEAPVEKKEEIALSFLGRLLTEGSFNARVMKNALTSIWKPSKGLVVRDLDNNLFLFQFFSAADKKDVLDEGP